MTECCTDIVIDYGISWHFFVIKCGQFCYFGTIPQKMKINSTYNGQDSKYLHISGRLCSTSFTTWTMETNGFKHKQKHKISWEGGKKKLFVTFFKLTNHLPSDLKKRKKYFFFLLIIVGFKPASSCYKHYCSIYYPTAILFLT